ncbi:MAG: hypothetical protein ACI8VT_002051 [Saprospiraceae bacterium]
MYKSVSYFVGYAFVFLQLIRHILYTISKYIIIASLLISSLRANSANRTVQVAFYSEILSVEYPTEIILPGLLMVDDISLMDYYEKLDNTPYYSFLVLMGSYKEKYHLNDWLYYELLKTTINTIFIREGPLKKGVTLWFLLTKSGFDTRLSYLDNSIYIYVWSKEDIFETPMIMDQDKKFINLSGINTAKESPSQLNLLLFRPESEGKAFSFKMEKLPQLPAQIRAKEVRFMIKQRSFRITFNIDATLFEIMKSYPAIAEKEYFNIPMSEVTYTSLIPKLQFMIKDKPISEALEILVAFTRTGFEYRDDNEVFGKSKPMIAEELFHYRYSDCEDRSALFFYLVKEILHLPMLIIAYPDHLTIAVASDELKGQPFLFDGLNYYICDPTGPVGSNIIGVPPNGYENLSFDILGAYHK